MLYRIQCCIRHSIRHRRYSSSCLKGCKSAGPCLWNLVLLSTCVSIFLQLFSELSSLTCDSYCALKTRATPILSHTPSDSVDLCRDRLVHGPPLLPPASPFKQNLFEERPILATPTPGFRGYVQPLHVQHPSSSLSPLGGNQKLSCSTKIGAVKLSDIHRGSLLTWLVRRRCLWTATRPFLGY